VHAPTAHPATRTVRSRTETIFGKTTAGLGVGHGFATPTELAPSDFKAMTELSRHVAELLNEAGETHHLVYRIVDGEDPDWASWYADWLLRLSELPQLLGTMPVRSELVWLLVSLDKDYIRENPETPWPQWYAERVIDHFSPAAG
jgi:hypothetical protein